MRKKSCQLITITFFILLLSSCATTLHVNVMRPAELDLNGAKTIAVLPIKPCEYYEIREDARGVDIFVSVFFQMFDRVGPEEKRCIEKLQYNIEKGLMESQFIELISASKVSAALKNGTSNPADVYLTGEITTFDVYDEKHDRRVKIKDGDDEKKPEYAIVHEYRRIAKLYFKYQIVDGATGKIISFNRVELKDSSGYYEHARDLPSAYSLLEYELESTARKILRELQPYTVSKSIVLMKDKSKNEAFKYADKLAKNGQIKEAYKEFIYLYEETGMMAAGYNAAKLQEAMGNLSEAEKIMTKVYKENPVTEVMNGLKDIQQEIKQASRLKSQTENSDVLDLDF